jgi:hypothetical protein
MFRKNILILIFFMGISGVTSQSFAAEFPCPVSDCIACGKGRAIIGGGPSSIENKILLRDLQLYVHDPKCHMWMDADIIYGCVDAEANCGAKRRTLHWTCEGIPAQSCEKISQKILSNAGCQTTADCYALVSLPGSVACHAVSDQCLSSEVAQMNSGAVSCPNGTTRIAASDPSGKVVFVKGSICKWNTLPNTQNPTGQIFKNSGSAGKP